MKRCSALIGVCVLMSVLVGAFGFGAAPALAHPLGNFSVNHHHRLTFTAGRIIDDAVIDSAEIPTVQADPRVDVDGSGTASTTELEAYGRQQCEALRRATSLTIDGTATSFVVTNLSFAYQTGQAGLPTSRLECRFEAPADLTVARTVTFADGYLNRHVGWREIVATGGDGARLAASSVPQASTTDNLRSYPLDLLSSPLDVRSATFEVVPGDGPITPAPTVTNRVRGADSGFFSGVIERVDRVFNDLIGRRQLTLGVGLLAIALALVLGASHALLPGHGKTVMAAYIAGRQGSVRDAVIVGATVTGTHTGGVLLLGLALTLSTSLAGESVLGWLGVSGGLLVAALGAGLLISSIRNRGAAHGLFAHGHIHSYDFAQNDGEHVHDHAHDHAHQHVHFHGGRAHSHGGVAHAHHAHEATRGLPGYGSVINTSVPSSRSQLVAGGSTAVLDLESMLATAPQTSTRASATFTSVDAVTAQARKSHSRRGLIGMGIAGGLVPSPSALVILLSAIALGRTAFGILLVIGYGLGMAGTLTAAGVLLVKVRDRLQGRMASSTGRLRSAASRWGRVAPYLTATLVLVVGMGMAIRSFSLV